MEEYVFLKRKPRVFLIGNPKELGFKEEKVEHSRYSKLVDDYGVDWYHAVRLSIDTIICNENIPYGLRLEWYEDTLYVLESPKDGVSFKKQGYQEFWKRSKKALKSDGELFEFHVYSPPITKYAIPKAGTKERLLFSMFVRVYLKLLDEREKEKEEIKKHLDAIKNILG